MKYLFLLIKQKYCLKSLNDPFGTELLHPGVVRLHPADIRRRVPASRRAVCRQVRWILRGGYSRDQDAMSGGENRWISTINFTASTTVTVSTGVSQHFGLGSSLQSGLRKRPTPLRTTSCLPVLVPGADIWTPCPRPGQSRSGCGLPDEAVVNSQNRSSQGHGQDVDHHGAQSHPLLVGAGRQLRLLLPGVGDRPAPILRAEPRTPLVRVPHVSGLRVQEADCVVTRNR